MSIRRPANPQTSERHLAEELDALRRLELATFGLTGETESRALLDGIVAAAIEITRADFGELHLIDESTGCLRLKISHGLPRAYKHFSELGNVAADVALEKGERVIIRDVEANRIFQKKELRETLRQADIHSCQATPLRGASRRLLGTVTTYYRSPKEPPGRGMRLLNLFARHAADLIEQLQHREKLEILVSERALELKEMNRALHHLSGRLLHAQDVERRRIARELHDTTAQQIGFIAMSLGHLSKNLDGPQPAVRKVITEGAEAARKALAELRTVSYLLHPPLLDELGLPSAVRAYASGFEKRSGIRTEVIIPSFPRLSEDVELSLFRVIQEALTNVHRYSGSETARIELAATETLIELSIEDRGRGMIIPSREESDEKLGVGIPGMRERLRQFGGSLRIESSDRGTRILANVPFERALRSGEIVPQEAPRPMIQSAPAQSASASGPKQILVVDDFELSRAGTRAVLQNEADFEICGEAASGQEAIAKAVELKPDLVLLDLSLPDMAGLRVAIELRKRGIGSKILFLTVRSSPNLLAIAQQMDCCEGYVRKGVAGYQLVDAIRTIFQGHTAFLQS